MSLQLDTSFSTAYKLNPQLPLKFGCCEGNCTTCKIKIIEGQENLSPKTKQEKKHALEDSCRLACQCAILGDIKVF